VKLVGRSESRALFASEDRGAVVDLEKNFVVDYGDLESLMSSAAWNTENTDPDKISGVAKELATAIVTDFDITVLSASDRMYTIPKAVQSEAKRGLKWRKEEGRGGTSVGMNTARTLSGGGQVGIKKVRHIAKYFPRHEVDKKGKGYKPGQDGYPSNGRIAWALWGGDSAQRWASAIVERENKKKSSEAAITAAFAEEYYDEKRVDYESFSHQAEPEFFLRIRLDDGSIDRLYKVDEDGTCRIWDDGYWDDLGNVEHDFETYDKVLDDPYDQVKKIHLPVDRESAVAISAIFDSNPASNIFLQEINFEETDIFERAVPEVDWRFVDQLSDDTVEDTDEYWDEESLLAAATEFAEEEGDGEYTPEERSENASQQVRDKMGRFAQNGSRVVIGGDYNYQGTVTAQNPDAGTVSVQMDNGSTVEVPGNTTQEISTFEPITYVPPSTLDTTGILGEPRTPIDQPGARLPGTLPPLTSANVSTAINDWGAWTSDQRLAPEYEPQPAPPFIPKKVPDINTAMGQYYQGAFNPDGTPKSSWNPAIAPNVANDPLLRDWLDSVYGGSSGSYQGGWFKPSVPVDQKKSRSEVYSKENQQNWDEKYNVYLSTIIAAALSEDDELTPENSDVAPMYLAIVSPDDPQAVMDLVALVPASIKSNQPVTYKREPGKWIKDERALNDLRSPTPPPVIVLDNFNLSDVVQQIDGREEINTNDRTVEEEAKQQGGVVAASRLPSGVVLSNNPVMKALLAAGGLDRNRGNAEKLRRYWTIGKGGLKIRWNTPGDWTRCNRQLKKYMGPRAKGYCALRHKEMTGVWPGDKRNVGKKKKSLRSSAMVASVEGLKSEEQIITDFTLRARANAAKSRLVGRSGISPKEHGARFVIPLVIPEETETGDGRFFKKNSISLRDLPLPLMWQIKSGQGHDGSVVVGQIFHMERTSEGIGNAIGVFDKGDYGKEAERLVRNGFIRGVSADMDKFEADEPSVPEVSEEESEEKDSGRINITSARVMAVTIVPKPAFQECFIQIMDEDNSEEENEMQPADGIYVDGVNPLDASALVACGLVADAIPVDPPKSWFENPKLQGPTPLTIKDDGRVFGHIAAWHVDHIGMAHGTRPPRSRSNYAYFHTGVLKTLEGNDVPVGQLTLAGGHAGLEADAVAAVRHYDDTASAFADVHTGEDAFGIWVAGSLRPGTTPEQIRAARASAPSGDWRPIKGRLELVAVCQVNVPGFPIARARVASGQVMALVAAGAQTLAQLKYDPLTELSQKISNLEAAQFAPLAEEAKSRFSTLRQEFLAERHAELAAKVGKAKETQKEKDEWLYMIEMMDDDPENEMAVISRRVRVRLAKEGKALDDGSFPIRNISDLRNAIQAYGRSKPGSRAKVRRHIMKRAKQLDRRDLVPQKWSTSYSSEENPLLERALAAAAAFELKDRKFENSEALFSLDVFAEEDEDADLEDLNPDEIEAIKQEVRRKKEEDSDGRPKFTPQTQPRDAQGKFRTVLARLKNNLGVAGLQKVMEKVEEAENLSFAGNYAEAAKSAADLLDIIDRLDTRALNPESIENVRDSSRELGETIANLPFAFGQQTEKIRFSDVPPALQDLMKDMISRVEDKLGDPKEADEATADLRSFMSGGDYYSQADISSQMSKLLRLLT
jgi:hypothetical protein